VIVTFTVTVVSKQLIFLTLLKDLLAVFEKDQSHSILCVYLQDSDTRGLLLMFLILSMESESGLSTLFHCNIECQ
jgi:hypothetical protein